jgi:WD40 repeat protein/tRNA A-37 threonylcarbamoyl transferase component Bud32
MNERERKEIAVFNAALELSSPAERTAYLKQACGDEPALRQRVEALLRVHAAADEFFDKATENAGARLSPAVAAARGPSGTVALTPLTEGPGTVIGRYKLLQQIGEGGFGAVYMAEQKEPVKRRVALKIIKLGMDTRQVVARFEAERQALALMDHPNIAKVFDAGATESGRPYFVMELVRGVPITQYCDENNLPPLERLKLFTQVCHAIQHAHQKGIIHRDVKPSNILVTLHDGLPVPKVIDFGIAKATQQELTEKTVFTQFQQFIGTPAYMSPEQAELSGLDIDTRSDIYALGVLLYELLTGKTPFDAKELLAAGLDEMRRTIREREPVRPSTRVSTMADVERTSVAKHRQSEVPKLIHLLRGDLDWIVMKCLEKDRTHRYETANGLARDLERHLSHQPVMARPPSTAYRMQKFVRRNKVIVAAGSAVAGALVLGIVISTWQAIRARQAEGKAAKALKSEAAQRQKAEKAQEGEAAQRKVAEDKTEESRQRLVQLNVASGARLLNESQTFASLPWLVEALRLEQGRAEGEDLQRRRLGMVLQQCPKLAQIWFHEGPVSCAAFSPAGRRVATGTGLANAGTGQAKVWDVDSGQPVGRPMLHGRGVNQLRFSPPDGCRIATASADGTARLWDADSGEPVTPPLSHGDSVLGLAFSRDGTLLATASRDNTARVWDPQSGRPVTGPLQHLFTVGGVDFSPDGKRLVTVSGDGLLCVWDAQVGTNLLTKGHWSHQLAGVQWSPDGSKWVTASMEITAKLWDASQGKELATLQHDAGVSRAAFSPDGRWVVTASADKTARVWDAQTGTPRTPPLQHDGEVYDAEFSPDGLAVVTASGDHTARVWDAKTGQPLTPSLPHQDEVKQAVFSPDGHHLLTVGNDGTARLWELAVGGPFVELNHRLPVTRLALSLDQRRVLTASADGTAQLWDLKTGERVRPPIRHVRAVSVAAFSPDGQRLLTASFDRTARVWEAGTGNPVTPPLLHQEGVTHAGFSPDGRRVATASTDKTAAVWDAATGQRITPFLVHDREVQWVAFSPDGQRLVTACRDRLARVWDATSGKALLRLTGHTDWILQAVFSPNGRQILTASTDKTARLWDAVTGERRVVLGHSGIVITAAFNADGNRIVTASYDHTARVWDADTGQAVTPPLRHGDRVEQAAFSSDGRWVVTASWDRTVRLWSATTGDPVTPAIRLGEGVRAARLSADGQILVAASGSAAHVWNLAKEERPVADLHLITELLTGQATDTQGRVVPLDVRQVWQTLKAKPSEPRADAPTAVRAWHRRALAQALERQDGFAARFHVDRLLDFAPGDDSLRGLRARLQSSQAGATAGEGVVSDEFAEACSRIPPPAEGTPENLIDLSAYYTRPLADAPHTDWPVETYNFSSLTRGIQTLAGVKFDLRGLVRLLGSYGEPGRSAVRERITGIKIARRCRRLHFLHGTGWVEAEGKEIAKYVIHYADGQLNERPVRYGNDVRNFIWLTPSDLLEHKDAVRAWTGTNALTAENGLSLRLYKSVWENPRPDVPVASIDFISTMTACHPFLIAITAE